MTDKAKAAAAEWERRVGEGFRTQAGPNFDQIGAEIRAEYGLSFADFRSAVIGANVTEPN